MQSTTTPRSYAQIEAEARRLRAEAFRDMMIALRAALRAPFAAKGQGANA